MITDIRQMEYTYHAMIEILARDKQLVLPTSGELSGLYASIAKRILDRDRANGNDRMQQQLASALNANIDSDVSMIRKMIEDQTLVSLLKTKKN
ncbi:hypothetical protein [Shewanella sp. MBTL60-007]|uniref:hypothetical protein n=1 Tax=Shewanella sp. MBTL60-007 TaxID=2815911 RepID=UPI001BC234BF|nr:hypothetical protein [Shewanella sp. MBTL60-007]GIU31791.1 hypothetical protein TUM3792_43810 [Shewanella sp. MBTL60-007]